MKHLFVLITFIVFATNVFAQIPSQFVIGAVDLNNFMKVRNNDISSEEWVKIRDLGLNFGVVGLFTYLNPDNNDWTGVYAARQLLTNAATNDVSIALSYSAWGGVPAGRRWEYDPEWEQHFTFNQMVGDTATQDKGNTYPDADLIHRTANARQVTVGDNSAGYIANGFLLTKDQPDSVTYYLKVRMKLALNTPLTHRPVVHVYVYHGGSNFDTTIYADQFSGPNVFQDISALAFDKFLDLEPPSVPPYSSSLQQESQIPLGVPNYGANRLISPDSSEYDYKVYWPDSVSCYLDCIYIDDTRANDAFNGVKDDSIRFDVNLFNSGYGALGKYVVADEVVDPAQLLPLAHVCDVITTTVVLNPTKTGYHYNIGQWSYGNEEKLIHRDTYWTKPQMELTDSYPISHDIPLPDGEDYLNSFQSCIQNSFIKYLVYHIQETKRNFNIPFWLTLQAHSWIKVHDPNSNDLREPTCNELKLMANIGLAYGAKGIIYSLYWSNNQYDNIYGTQWQRSVGFSRLING